MIASHEQINVSASGYEPSQVTGVKDAPLTIEFTRTEDVSCGKEIVIRSLGIKKELPLNVPVDITFTPTAIGEISFTCGTDMMKGSIVIVESVPKRAVD